MSAVLPKKYTGTLSVEERQRFKRIVDAIDNGIESRSPKDNARLLKYVAAFFGYRILRGKIFVERVRRDPADWWK